MEAKPEFSATGRDVLQAEKRAREARDRFSSTLNEFQHSFFSSLSAESLADSAWQVFKKRSVSLGREAASFIGDRPIKTAAGVGAVIALLAGRPILKAVKGSFSG